MIWAALLLLILVILVPASYKKRFNDTPTNINQGLNIFDDFLEPSITSFPFPYQGTSFIGTTSGAATVDQTIAYGNRNYPGAVAIALNTSGSVGTLTNRTGLTLTFSSSIDMQTRFFLSGFIQNCVHSFGISDSIQSRGSELNSAVFIANRNISNNFICYVKSSTTGTSQQVITSVPVILDTDYYLRIISTPNISYFYINAVLVAQINIRISNAAHYGCGWYCESTGAITPVTCTTDAISLTQAFTTPRSFQRPFATV